MKMLAVALLMMNNSSFASTPESYDVKIDLLLNGKHVSSPRVIVKEGETATIIQKTKTVDNFIQVMATKSEAQNQDGIMIKFTVGEIGKNGERTIVAQPEVIAKEKEPTQVTVGAKEKGPEKLSLSVVATKKTL